jgi:hypothetical protein
MFKYILKYFNPDDEDKKEDKKEDFLKDFNPNLLDSSWLEKEKIFYEQEKINLENLSNSQKLPGTFLERFVNYYVNESPYETPEEIRYLPEEFMKDESKIKNFMQNISNYIFKRRKEKDN